MIESIQTDVVGIKKITDEVTSRRADSLVALNFVSRFTTMPAVIYSIEIVESLTYGTASIQSEASSGPRTSHIHKLRDNRC